MATEPEITLEPTGFGTKIWAANQLLDDLVLLELRLDQLEPVLGWPATITDRARQKLIETRDMLLESEQLDVLKVRDTMNSAERVLWDIRPEKFGEVAYRYACWSRNHLSMSWVMFRDLVEAIDQSRL